MVCNSTAEFHQLDGNQALLGSYEPISTSAATRARAVAVAPADPPAAPAGCGTRAPASRIAPAVITCRICTRRFTRSPRDASWRLGSPRLETFRERIVATPDNDVNTAAPLAVPTHGRLAPALRRPRRETGKVE